MKSLMNFIAALIPLCGFSQAGIVFNGANIQITQNAFLVIDNPSPNALQVLTTGGILSEGSNNNLIWNMGTLSANYRIPFVSGNNPIPVSFSTTGGSGNGRYTFSTYAGADWQNSDYLPPTVTNMDLSGVDNSAHTIDRFWQINPSGYSTVPTLSNLIFTYNEVEWNAPGDHIVELNLTAENWTSGTSTWNVSPGGTDAATANQVKILSLPVATYDPWWTLFSADVALPLTLLDFTAEKENKNVKLQWLVTAEMNTDFYEVQRSMNAVDFASIGTVASVNNFYATTQYSYIDTLNGTQSGAIYYRLRMVDIDGKFSYSPVRFISFTDQTAVKVFPNPVTSLAVIQFGALPADNYQVAIFSEEGRLILQRNLDVTPNSTFYVQRGTNMIPGTYIYLITGKNYRQSFTIIYK